MIVTDLFPVTRPLLLSVCACPRVRAASAAPTADLDHCRDGRTAAGREAPRLLRRDSETCLCSRGAAGRLVSVCCCGNRLLLLLLNMKVQEAADWSFEQVNNIYQSFHRRRSNRKSWRCRCRFNDHTFKDRPANSVQSVVNQFYSLLSDQTNGVVNWSITVLLLCEASARWVIDNYY